MATLKWQDADEIGLQLSVKYPEVAPLAVRFSDLHRRVNELEDFSDDPSASNEGLLEAIQMAWQEYHERIR